MRNEPLDWLRGLLAVSIMLDHLAGWEIAQQDASSVLGRLGAHGVSMFFVLSGLSWGKRLTSLPHNPKSLTGQPPCPASAGD